MAVRVRNRGSVGVRIGVGVKFRVRVRVRVRGRARGSTLPMSRATFLSSSLSSAVADSCFARSTCP